MPPVEGRQSKTNRAREFEGLVVLHAATYGGMLVNFGRPYAEALVNGGAKLHFVCSKHPVYGARQPVPELRELSASLHQVDLPPRLAPKPGIATTVAFYRLCRRLRPDIVHTRSSLMGLYGRIAARIAGVPCLLHHQDDLYSRDAALAGLTRRTAAGVERALAAMTDRSLFISQVVLDTAGARGFPRDRCVLVGVDPHPRFLEAVPRFDRGKEQHPIIEGAGVPRDAVLVGCLARLLRLKGVDTLVRAARLVADRNHHVCFFIRGTGPEERSLEKLARETGLQGRVFFSKARVPFEEVPRLHRSFDIFCLPTRREGFGMVFAEAMALGVPVVCPRIAPVTEVVPGRIGVFVEPEDVRGYAEAILSLASDPARREELGRLGRRYAVERFGTSPAREAVLEVYRDVVRTMRAERR